MERNTIGKKEGRNTGNFLDGKKEEKLFLI